MRAASAAHFFPRPCANAIGKSPDGLRLSEQTSRLDAGGKSAHLYPAAEVTVDAPRLPRLLIGSHLDTVPNAGAYDGILGVVLAVALLEYS